MTADSKIRDAVLKASADGKISCSMARKLASELKVKPSEIGAACNELKIKIISCELGCF